MKDKIYIINGPNLNKLGTREPDKYGTLKLQEIENICKKKCEENDFDCTFFQSNIEGEIVNLIHDAIDEKISAIIINAAAYTHTSVGIGDAVKAIKTKVIEVHISNTFSREDFRHSSFITPYAKGLITGFGLDSYYLAVSSFVLNNYK